VKLRTGCFVEVGVYFTRKRAATADESGKDRAFPVQMSDEGRRRVWLATVLPKNTCQLGGGSGAVVKLLGSNFTRVGSRPSNSLLMGSEFRKRKSESEAHTPHTFPAFQFSENVSEYE
jgi:hypothetical protein